MTRQSDGAVLLEVSCACGWSDVVISGDNVPEHDEGEECD